MNNLWTIALNLINVGGECEEGWVLTVVLDLQNPKYRRGGSPSGTSSGERHTQSTHQTLSDEFSVRKYYGDSGSIIHENIR